MTEEKSLLPIGTQALDGTWPPSLQKGSMNPSTWL